MAIESGRFKDPFRRSGELESQTSWHRPPSRRWCRGASRQPSRPPPGRPSGSSPRRSRALRDVRSVREEAAPRAPTTLPVRLLAALAQMKEKSPPASRSARTRRQGLPAEAGRDLLGARPAALRRLVSSLLPAVGLTLAVAGDPLVDGGAVLAEILLDPRIRHSVCLQSADPASFVPGRVAVATKHGESPFGCRDCRRFLARCNILRTETFKSHYIGAAHFCGGRGHREQREHFPPE